GLSYTLIGLLSSSFNLASMIFAPFLGALSDRLLKRKGFLVVGSLIAFVVSVSYFFVQTGTQLLIIGFFNGVAYAFFPLINAIFRENIPTQRARSFGWFSASNSLGWGIGGMTAGILADAFGLKSAFVMIGFFHLLNALLALRLIPEKKIETEKSSSTSELPKKVVNLYVAFALRHTGAMALWSVFPLYLQLFIEDISLLGILFSINFLLQPFFMILVSRYTENTDKIKLFTGGIAGTVVVFWVFATAREVWQVAAAQLAISFVWAVMIVAMYMYLMEEVPGGASARAFGFLHSSQTLAAVVGPMIGGLLTEILGFRDMILIASAIIASSLVLSIRLLAVERRLRERKQTSGEQQERREDA
ncbi:MAG: MFS transporter, partial [Candidatus Geothermarchaeales archaeon]